MKAKTKKQIEQELEDIRNQKNQMKWIIGELRYQVYNSKIDEKAQQNILNKIDELFRFF